MPVIQLIGQWFGNASAVGALIWVGQVALGGPVGDKNRVSPRNVDPDLTWREERGISHLVPRWFGRDGGKLFELAQVAQHNTIDDLWIIVDECVYDITKFAPTHPGGIGPLRNMAGKDCTDAFANFHSLRVYKYFLPHYLIGKVSDVQKVASHVIGFRAIHQELLRLGLFETDYRYYWRLGAFFVFLFCGAVHLTMAYTSFGMHLLGGAVMGIFWQQLAGLGHDLGHSAVTHQFHRDHQIGSLLTTLMGLSVCWWKSDHNTHHVVCNAVEHDPNINYMPLLAITPKSFEKPYFESYHNKQVAMDSLARFLVSYQHYFSNALPIHRAA